LVRIYCANIKDFDLSIADSFPIRLKEEVAKYKFEVDQLRCALGKFLLKSALQSDYNLDKEVLTYLERDALNKPYLSNTDLHFNISHAGDYVVCAVANCEIGIDIEQVKPIDLEDFNAVLNANDHEFINSFAQEIPAFFNVWSIKEAIMKADGRGMHIDPKEIYPDYTTLNCTLDELSWSIQKVNIDLDYSCYLASGELLKTKVIPVKS